MQSCRSKVSLTCRLPQPPNLLPPSPSLSPSSPPPPAGGGWEEDWRMKVGAVLGRPNRLPSTTIPWFGQNNCNQCDLPGHATWGITWKHEKPLLLHSMLSLTLQNYFWWLYHLSQCETSCQAGNISRSTMTQIMPSEKKPRPHFSVFHAPGIRFGVTIHPPLWTQNLRSPGKVHIWKQHSFPLFHFMYCTSIFHYNYSQQVLHRQILCQLVVNSFGTKLNGFYQR